MYRQGIKLFIICEPRIEKDIEAALTNSGIQFRTGRVEEPVEGYSIYIPDAIPCLSVALHILEARKDEIEGSIDFPDGTRYELTDEGRNELREVLTNAMTSRREIIPEAQWWTPFIPEIKEHIIPEIREFMKTLTSILAWYPKASGESQRVLTRNFLLLIVGIVAAVWILTYLDKISGDAFIFVVGALLGYVFAFLERFLGLFPTKEQ